MIVAVLLNKIKSFIFIFVNIFRRALCCFRRRRRSSCESVPLTHVVSNNEEGKQALQTWDDWGDDRKEKTVQDHIEMYRKQTQVLRQSKSESDSEEQLNFFEDMTPNITKQTKVLISTDQGGSFKNSNRLNFVEDSISAVVSNYSLSLLIFATDVFILSKIKFMKLSIRTSIKIIVNRYLYIYKKKNNFSLRWS